MAVTRVPAAANPASRPPTATTRSRLSLRRHPLAGRRADAGAQHTRRRPGAARSSGGTVSCVLCAGAARGSRERWSSPLERQGAGHTAPQSAAHELPPHPTPRLPHPTLTPTPTRAPYLDPPGVTAACARPSRATATRAWRRAASPSTRTTTMTARCRTPTRTRGCARSSRPCSSAPTGASCRRVALRRSRAGRGRQGGAAACAMGRGQRSRRSAIRARWRFLRCLLRPTRHQRPSRHPCPRVHSPPAARTGTSTTCARPRTTR